MKTDLAVAYFGTRAAIARALGIKGPSVSEWGDYPPMLRQLQIERLTGGALKAEWQPPYRDGVAPPQEDALDAA